MAGHSTPMLLPRELDVDVNACTARELLDYFRLTRGIGSLRELGLLLGVNEQYPQRWYRNNRLPATARALLKLHITARGTSN